MKSPRIHLLIPALLLNLTLGAPVYSADPSDVDVKLKVARKIGELFAFFHAYEIRAHQLSCVPYQLQMGKISIAILEAVRSMTPTEEAANVALTQISDLILDTPPRFSESCWEKGRVFAGHRSAFADICAKREEINQIQVNMPRLSEENLKESIENLIHLKSALRYLKATPDLSTLYLKELGGIVKLYLKLANPALQEEIKIEFARLFDEIASPELKEAPQMTLEARLRLCRETIVAIIPDSLGEIVLGYSDCDIRFSDIDFLGET